MYVCECEGNEMQASSVNRTVVDGKKTETRRAKGLRKMLSTRQSSRAGKKCKHMFIQIGTRQRSGKEGGKKSF